MGWDFKGWDLEGDLGWAYIKRSSSPLLLLHTSFLLLNNHPSAIGLPTLGFIFHLQGSEYYMFQLTFVRHSNTYIISIVKSESIVTKDHSISLLHNATLSHHPLLLQTHLFSQQHILLPRRRLHSNRSIRGAIRRPAIYPFHPDKNIHTTCNRRPHRWLSSSALPRPSRQLQGNIWEEQTRECSERMGGHGGA